MLIVTSRLLTGVRHGFSTRRGGVSTGRYATLNVGGKWGDDPEHVAHNRRRLAAAGGFAWACLYTAKQVHGARVALVVEGTLAERVADS
ncbi:MAG: polyphenol oxidase family protein, partial [Myxococcales bacterium]|nr:polyphenol oxidase family protein [Myxococcales bacterium]